MIDNFYISNYEHMKQVNNGLVSHLTFYNLPHKTSSSSALFILSAIHLYKNYVSLIPNPRSSLLTTVTFTCFRVDQLLDSIIWKVQLAMVLKLDSINWLSPEHHPFIELTVQVMHTSLEQMIFLGIKADSQVQFS